jgi:hypothetical protein
MDWDLLCSLKHLILVIPWVKIMSLLVLVEEEEEEEEEKIIMLGTCHG